MGWFERARGKAKILGLDGVNSPEPGISGLTPLQPAAESSHAGVVVLLQPPALPPPLPPSNTHNLHIIFAELPQLHAMPTTYLPLPAPAQPPSAI